MQNKLDFERLIKEQKRLIEQVNSNTEVTHRLLLHQEKPTVIQEAFEGLEVLMTTIKNELAAISKTNSLAGSIVSIKNHITSLLDITTQNTNEVITDSLQKISSELSTGLRSINDEICHLNQLTVDLNASTAMNTNPMLSFDILDELKSWSANLISSQNSQNSPPSLEPLSLEAELNHINDKKS